jgi:hypothetical protein
MPLLEGNRQDQSLYGWYGTLITRYQQMNQSKTSIRYLLAERLREIAFIIATSLVQSKLYLHAVSDCQVKRPDLYTGGLDLFVSLETQPFKSELSDSEIAYWTSKFGERLHFDFRAYATAQLNDQTSQSTRDIRDQNLFDVSDRTVDNVVRDFNNKATRAAIEMVAKLDARSQNRKREDAQLSAVKWDIVNRGKLKGE